MIVLIPKNWKAAISILSPLALLLLNYLIVSVIECWLITFIPHSSATKEGMPNWIYILIIVPDVMLHFSNSWSARKSLAVISVFFPSIPIYKATHKSLASPDVVLKSQASILPLFSIISSSSIFFCQLYLFYSCSLLNYKLLMVISTLQENKGFFDNKRRVFLRWRFQSVENKGWRFSTRLRVKNR